MKLFFLLLMELKYSFDFWILSILHFEIIQFFYCFLIQIFDRLIKCFNFKLKSINLRFMFSCHLIKINKFLQCFARLFTFIQYKLINFRHLFIRWLLKVRLLSCCFVLKFIYFILKFIYHIINLLILVLRMFGFLFTCIYFLLVILQSQVEVYILIIDNSIILLNWKFAQA